MWKIIVTYLLAKWGAFIAWVQQNPSVIIALCALFVSMYSMLLSRQAFITTHRPYIYAVSRSENDSMDLNTILVGCSNAPARIISSEISYFIFDTKANGEEIIRDIKFQKKFPDEDLLHPSEKPKKQITVIYDFKKNALGLEPGMKFKYPEIKFRRKVRIDYKELSSNRTYFFEGNWDYNRDYDVWEDKRRFGN